MHKILQYDYKLQPEELTSRAPFFYQFPVTHLPWRLWMSIVLYWTRQYTQAAPQRTASLQNPANLWMQTLIPPRNWWTAILQVSRSRWFSIHTSGSNAGPSKLLSMYLTKSKLSPFTSLLCSSEGTCRKLQVYKCGWRWEIQWNASLKQCNRLYTWDWIEINRTLFPG